MNNESGFSSAIDAVDALASVLEQENSALADADFGVSAMLAETKRIAIGRVQDLAGTGVGDHPRAGVEAARRRLDDAIAANRRLLRSAIEIQQLVVETLLRSLDARDVAPASLNYGPDPDGRHRAPVALALRA